MTHQYISRILRAFYVLVCWLVLAPATQAQPGTIWTSRTSAADNQWTSVTYGNGLFVAVAANASGNPVMTSPDGITWTARTAAADNNWASVTYGNGLFVAVADFGSDRVMTSPDGIIWTSRTSAADNDWYSVTYGNGLFVAVAASGSGNRVMTSPDGITWTARTAAADNNWASVTYGNGLFVAVATSGSGNRVMTSPDGITWTARTAAADNEWQSVIYGNGLFVAVAVVASGNQVMTSPDGITWTARTAAANEDWRSVTYGNGLFVAVSGSGGNQVMTSPDGITWTARTAAAFNFWYSVTYGNGRFVAVASSGSGSGNRVMTSEAGPLPVSLVNFTAQAQPDKRVALNWATSWETNNKGYRIERSKDLITFETVGELTEVAPNSTGLTKYSLTDSTPFMGTSYYRLTQTDLSGKATTYPAVSVVIREEDYGVFPNPVVSEGGFVLRLDEPQTAILGFYSPQGRALPLLKTGVQSGNLLLKTSGSLPAGIYLLTVQERGQTRQHRVVVQ